MFTLALKQAQTRTQAYRLIAIFLLVGGVALILHCSSRGFHPSQTSDSISNLGTGATLSSEFTILQYHTYSPKHQYYELAQGSVKNHQRYAKLWDYRYKFVSHDYLDEDWKGTDWSNKVFVLLHALLDELEQPNGSRWILYTDVDTFIVNPLISISDILPPVDLQTRPILIAAQDAFGGFNAGVGMWSVSHKTVEFLSAVLALHHKAVLDFTELGIGDRLPSAQRCMAMVLENQPSFGDHLYEIPQVWWNSYDDPPESTRSESPTPFGSEGMAYHLQAQVHLVHTLKSERNWKVTANLGSAKFKELEDSKASGFLGHNEERQAIKRVAQAWWAESRSGASHFKFGIW